MKNGLKIQLFLGLVAPLLSLKALAGSETHGNIQFPVTREKAELILRISYSMECNPKAEFHGLNGMVILQDRKVRFDLFESAHETTLQLGAASFSKAVNARYTIQGNPQCLLKMLQLEPDIADLNQLAKVDEDQALALAHSPFLVIRDDEYGNRLTDLPLLMTYSVIPGRNKRIRYTIFFSDEDSEWLGNQTEVHMTRYGRRTDIEWIYEVELNSKGKIISEQYQGNWINDNVIHHSEIYAHNDVTHTTSRFVGKYLDDGSGLHPILYNIANNNVFSPFPGSSLQAQSLVGYHLIPSIRVDSPWAREAAMFKAPWTFRVSDQEMVRENKLYRSFSDDYLYALIDGDLKLVEPWNLVKGFLASVQWGTEPEIVSGYGIGSIDRLGEDLWGRESYTGIPLGKERIQEIGKNHDSCLGEFSLKKTGPLGFTGIDLNVRNIRFFKLVRQGYSYSPVELTQAFQCKVGHLEEVRCIF